VIALGIHAYTHDSAAALVRDGEVIAAAEEERFNGEKHTDAFPVGAVGFCLEQAGIGLRDVDEVAIGWQPALKLSKRVAALLLHLPGSLRSLRASDDGRIKSSLAIWRSIRRLPATLVRHFGPAPHTRFSFLLTSKGMGSSAGSWSPRHSSALRSAM
jgi:carbamoyltransferase